MSVDKSVFGRWLRRVNLLGLCLLAGGVMAQTSVLINPGDQIEGDRLKVANVWRAAVETSLQQVEMVSVDTRFSSDATADLSATRANLYEIMVAPAPTIGSAVRYGYAPLVGASQTSRAVLVAAASSPVADWAQAKGKKLGMPAQDSVVTYLLRGEVQAGNTTLQRWYDSIYQTRFQDALLICLQLRRCDVVAVEKIVAQRWIESGEKVKIVWESPEVPGLSVALHKNAKVKADALRSALVAELNKLMPGAYSALLSSSDFEYVSTLGYFTPRVLEGATMVEDPARIEALLASGALYVDTRTMAEFERGHVPGAVLVPYVEKSAKDPGYDASLDTFEIASLDVGKDRALIFGCNGAECWKSFKASHAAVRAGYTNVYWFRSGFPGWRESGRDGAGSAMQAG